MTEIRLRQAKKSAMIDNRSDRVFQIIINVLTFLIIVVTMYPLIYVLSASISTPIHILDGSVWLWPVDITFAAYNRALHSADILTGYGNTIIYAIAGTAVNLVMTCMAAYPLSIKPMKGRNAITFMITFTMFFSGGIIPSYLNIKELGLLNTRWVMLLPGAINATNMLILRNYFINSVPGEMREAASIDGCSPIGTMLKIVLPLSKPILVVIMLYYLVGHWNAYFDAMMYLKDRTLYPLQVFLRNILLLSQMGDMAEQAGIDDINTVLMYASLKYAIIVVSAAPLLILYPLLQKFFEKGIMMGSLKG